MAQDTESVYRWVEWLKSGTKAQQMQAAQGMRNLAGDASSKHLIREAGGIECLLRLLDAKAGSGLTVISAETLSCLAADDSENRDLIRRYGGIQKLVSLLSAGPEAECTHRALLALRILTDREADRLAILKAGGIALLVGLLSASADSEVTEYAAAALGNLAAGSQQLKDAIRQAGGIPPLVRLLRNDPDEIAAELAAVVLRNLALQNATNRAAIREAGGLQPLLRLLSQGQDKLVYPIQCEVGPRYKRDVLVTMLAGKAPQCCHEGLPMARERIAGAQAASAGAPTHGEGWGRRAPLMYYNEEGKDGKHSHKQLAGQCCFDPSRGHLCVAVRSEGGVLGCFSPGKQPSPRDKNAERYSLLRKLTITEPDARTLELSFTVSDKEGAARLPDGSQKGSKRQRRLQRVSISPCMATEVKGAIMRMLTRMHLEREFKLGPTGGGSRQQAQGQGQGQGPASMTSGGSMAHFPMSTSNLAHRSPLRAIQPQAA